MSESALTSRIKSARRALGDDGRTESVIRIVHGRGYQFIALVTDSEVKPKTIERSSTAEVGVAGAPESESVSSDIDPAAARQAFNRARWHEARTEFARIGVDALATDDVERWAEASWWDSVVIDRIAMLEIGEIQLQRGDVDAAHAAFLHAHAHGANATVGLAYVAVEQGQPSDAVDLLQDALSARSNDRVARRQLLPCLVDAVSIAGLTEVADVAARELNEIMDDASDACRACAARSMGTVALIDGRAEDAAELMGTAVEHYGTASLPFELASARLGLAVAALSLGHVQTAKLERDAALASFEDAGVVPSVTARYWLSQLETLD